MVNIIGKMMVGGYAAVDPCCMLLYIHWIHFMVEMSQALSTPTPTAPS